MNLKSLPFRPSIKPVIFFTLCLQVIACNYPELTNALEELQFEISKKNIAFHSGTSFGECGGYCRTEMEVNGVDVVYKEMGSDSEDGNLPERIFAEMITVDRWNDLVAALDWQAFAALDSVIGCPDCADGGAEWLEVEYYGDKKKVVFEYGAKIDGIDRVVSIMRDIRHALTEGIGSGTVNSKIIITDQSPDSLQKDAFELTAATVVLDTLILDIAHSGGCKEHFYALYMSPAAFKESNPVQADLYLHHNDNNDACDAYLSSRQKFDILPVAELYEYYYGRLDKIILNVHEFDKGRRPGKVIQVEYEPGESYSL